MLPVWCRLWGLFLSTPSARRATPMSRSICARRSKFLSTPSARRATLYNHRHAHCCQISIHALREEGDVFFLTKISPIF